ncbi:MAG: hypothetical protein AAB425_06315, partial [Bdellovibrionota bacterium]
MSRQLTNQKIAVDRKKARLSLGSKLGETPFDTSYVLRRVRPEGILVNGERYFGNDAIVRIPLDRAHGKQVTALAERFRNLQSRAWKIKPPPDSPWAQGRLPIIPVHIAFPESDWGPIAIRPWVDGYSFKELVGRHGRELTPEIRKGLEDLLGRFARLEPLDLSPDNLIWVTGLVSQDRVGLVRSGFVLKEIRAPRRGWDPRKRSAYRAKLEQYLGEHPMIPWSYPDQSRLSWKISLATTGVIVGGTTLALLRSDQIKAREERLRKLSAMAIHSEVELIELAK